MPRTPGVTEDASGQIRVRGKETQDTNNVLITKQVTVSEDSVNDKVAMDVSIISGANGSLTSIPSEIERATFNFTTNSTDFDQTIVSAVTSKQIVVISMMLSLDNDAEIIFQSSTTTDLAPLKLVAYNSFVLNHNPYGWFATTAGELLNLNVSTDATEVQGFLNYLEI